jgi:hypothetical protein
VDILSGSEQETYTVALPKTIILFARTENILSGQQQESSGPSRTNILFAKKREHSVTPGTGEIWSAEDENTVCSQSETEDILYGKEQEMYCQPGTEDIFLARKSRPLECRTQAFRL